jgi:6-bladed beta-propeller protein
MKWAAGLSCVALLAVGLHAALGQSVNSPSAELRARIQRAPKLPLAATELRVQPPRPGWKLGMVSWIAVDRSGLIYLLQRGDKADPVVVLNRDGHVVRSWGKGLYTMPHAIRIDPQGNVWTTDAATSMVYKFSRQGEKLMEIAVGGTPTPCRDIVSIEKGVSTASHFCGTTDIAFAPNGHLYIADGYANGRILEYTADGKKVREWGSMGRGPGQFRLPHSIAIDKKGIVYVADRENGRIERFDLHGRYLGEWRGFGKTFSLKVQGQAIWLATQPLGLPNFSPGWLLKVDIHNGQLLGYVEATGVHGMEALSNGELMVGPGPNQSAPLWFKHVVNDGR